MAAERTGCGEAVGAAVGIPCGCGGAYLTLLGFLSFSSHSLPFLMAGFVLLGFALLGFRIAYRSDTKHHDDHE